MVVSYVEIRKMEKIQFSFEELRVYQKALDYIDFVYETTKDFPSDERFGLTSQYRRAAQSIALNIAEGAGDTNPQFNRFLMISQGSIKECIVCSTIATRQKFISSKLNQETPETLSQIAKMITNLQKYLKTNN